MYPLKKLSGICKIKTGKKDVNEGNPNGKFPFFTCARDYTFSDGYSFDTEALLIAGNGDVGHVQYYKGKFEAYQRTYILHDFSDDISVQYLFHYLAGFLKETVSKQKLGNTMPYIKLGMIADFEIPLPPIAKQHHIVAILNEAFEGLNQAVGNTEKNLQNTKEVFESYLHNIFEGTKENILTRPLFELCIPKRIITYGVIKLGKEFPNGVPCLRTSNVRWLKIECEGMKSIDPELSNEYSRTILQGGEVLVNVRGTLGGVAVVEREMVGWNVSREVAVIPIDPNYINPKYLSYQIGSPESQKWLGGVKKGAAYVGINIEDLRLFPTLTPSLEEQEVIVHILDQIQYKTKHLENIYQQKLAHLDELRKSLLQKAFNGEL